MNGDLWVWTTEDCALVLTDSEWDVRCDPLGDGRGYGRAPCPVAGQHRQGVRDADGADANTRDGNSGPDRSPSTQQIRTGETQHERQGGTKRPVLSMARATSRS